MTIGRQYGAARLRLGAAAAIFLAAALLHAPDAARAASCLYPSGAAGAAPSYACLTPVERALVELRKFRADMTVAALRCKQRSAYNEVVTRHQGELVSHGKALSAVFRRLYGASATRELNRYVTHLANRASIRSLGVRDYCRTMSRVFAAALQAPVRGFMAFLDSDPLGRANVAKKVATDGVPPGATNVAARIDSLYVP